MTPINPTTAPLIPNGAEIKQNGILENLSGTKNSPYCLTIPTISSRAKIAIGCGLLFVLAIVGVGAMNFFKSVDMGLNNQSLRIEAGQRAGKKVIEWLNSGNVPKDYPKGGLG